MPTRSAKTSSGRTADRPDSLLPFDDLKDRLTEVRKFMSRRLITGLKPVDSIFGSVGSGGGKMIRASLLLLCGKACGKIKPVHTELAGLVELIHTASLLHDDVIDQGRARRGRPTANLLFGNEFAVLMGDFLLADAFMAASYLNIDWALQILSDTAMRMCRGELSQNIHRRSGKELTESEYIETVGDKTASLFDGSCRLGAAASGAGPDTIRHFGACGFNLGVAFQISDDVLDITGDHNRMGKTLGRDFQQCKLTLPFIHFRDNSSQDRQKRLHQLTVNMQNLAASEDWKGLNNCRLGIAGLLGQNGSIGYCKDRALQFCRRAIEAIEPACSPSDVQKFSKVARFICGQFK